MKKIDRFIIIMIEIQVIANNMRHEFKIKNKNKYGL